MDQRKLSASANLLRLSTLGINFSLSIFVGLFMGWGLNKLFHWGTWLIVAGMILGVISSYVMLLEDLKTLNANTPDDKTNGPKA
jgi:F0F1-type ATP synthase assembly protein I